MHRSTGNGELDTGLDLADLWGASSDDEDSPYVSLYGTAMRDAFLGVSDRTEEVVSVITKPRQIAHDSTCQARLRRNDIIRGPSQPLARSPTLRNDQHGNLGHWSSTPASGCISPNFPRDGFASGLLAPGQPTPTATDQQLTVVTDEGPSTTEGFFHPHLPSTPPSCPARSTPLHAFAPQPLPASYRYFQPNELPGQGAATAAAEPAAPHSHPNQHGYRYPQHELQQQQQHDQLTASGSGVLLGAPFGSDGGTATGVAGPVGMSCSPAQQPPSAMPTAHPHPYPYPNPYPYSNRCHPWSAVAAGFPSNPHTLPHQRPPAAMRSNPRNQQQQYPAAASSSYPYGTLQDEYGAAFGPCTPPKSTWRFRYPPHPPPVASPFGPHAPAGAPPRYPGKLWTHAPPYPPLWPHARPAPHAPPPFAYGYPYPHPHAHPHTRAFPYPPHPTPAAPDAAAGYPDHPWPWRPAGRPTVTTATGTAPAAATAATAGHTPTCPHPHAAGWQLAYVPNCHQHHHTQQQQQQQQPTAEAEEDNGADTATSRATALPAAAPGAAPIHQDMPPLPPQQQLHEQHERPGAHVEAASRGVQQVQLPMLPPIMHSQQQQSPQQQQQQQQQYDDRKLKPPAAEQVEPLWPLPSGAMTAQPELLPWELLWEAPPQALRFPTPPQVHLQEAAAGMWCDAADADAADAALPPLPLPPPPPPLPPLPGPPALPELRPLGLSQELLQRVRGLEGSPKEQPPVSSVLAAACVKAEPQPEQQPQEQQHQQQHRGAATRGEVPLAATRGEPPLAAATEAAAETEQRALSVGRRASVRVQKVVGSRGSSAAVGLVCTMAAAADGSPGTGGGADAYEGGKQGSHVAAEPVPDLDQGLEYPAKEPLPEPVQVTVSSPSGTLMTHRVLGTFFPQPYLDNKECILVLKAPAGGGGQGQGNSQQGGRQQQQGEGQEPGTGGGPAVAGTAGSGAASPTKGGGGGGGKKGGASPVGGVGDMVSRSGFERLSGSMMAKWHRSIRVLPDGTPLGRWLMDHGLPVHKGCARRVRPVAERAGGSTGAAPGARPRASAGAPPAAAAGAAAAASAGADGSCHGGGGGDGIHGAGGGDRKRRRYAVAELEASASAQMALAAAAAAAGCGGSDEGRSAKRGRAAAAGADGWESDATDVESDD